ncbi:MAG TPA: DUF1353 domain-containing protein [Gammaproteobacteria bacterium]|nr:DUF1353 domain-containing protein [Gammaproteobacteria bacterium]
MDRKARKSVSFDGWTTPEGFRSDGCTMWPWLRRLLERFIDLDRYTPACVLHDFMRRHLVAERVVTIGEADATMRRHLLALGMWPPLAWGFWLAVLLMRPFFLASRPLPPGGANSGDRV